MMYTPIGGMPSYLKIESAGLLGQLRASGNVQSFQENFKGLAWVEKNKKKGWNRISFILDITKSELGREY